MMNLIKELSPAQEARLKEKFLIAVARELVIRLDDANQVRSSKELKVAEQEESEMFSSLLEKLDSEELKQKLMEYDDQVCFRATLMTENYFTEGYLEGHKAAKREFEAEMYVKEREALRA